MGVVDVMWADGDGDGIGGGGGGGAMDMQGWVCEDPLMKTCVYSSRDRNRISNSTSSRMLYKKIRSSSIGNDGSNHSLSKGDAIDTLLG